ncbi:MAG TPA: ABC transporter substrate-binding protein [Anaerolineales bacterium]|nr:ABC transporter substrate-binding protein [Anaerolineales bacterium]
MLKRFIILLPILILLSACGGYIAPQTSPALRPMTFMAGYKPQANLPFVGAYVAKEKGFFTQHGLAVQIEHALQGGEHLQLLAAGEVEVTTQDAAVLLQRRADPGLPLVSIALIGQHGQQAYVALAESGIATPKDWEGHKVGYKGTPPPDIFALMAANGVDASLVELVNVGFDPRVLTEGQVDVYPVFKSNEPNILRNMGFDLVQWSASDYGVPTLGLAYVTTETMVQDNPELLRDFVAAALEGIAYAEAHRDEAIEIVLKYAPEADPAHMRYMLDTELADSISATTETNGLGYSDLAQWQALYDLLWEYQAIAKPLDINQAFTNALIPK